MNIDIIAKIKMEPDTGPVVMKVSGKKSRETKNTGSVTMKITKHKTRKDFVSFFLKKEASLYRIRK